MVSLIYIYRIASFVLVTISAIIVLSLCIRTRTASQDKTVLEIIQIDFPQLFKSFEYSNLGIASGVLTLIGIPLMLIFDFFGGGTPIFAELAWFFLLCILFASTAAVTVKDADFSSIGSCDAFQLAHGVAASAETICNLAKPIEAFAIIAAIFVGLHICVVLFVSVSSAARGRSIWTGAIRPNGAEEKA